MIEFDRLERTQFVVLANVQHVNGDWEELYFGPFSNSSSARVSAPVIQKLTNAVSVLNVRYQSFLDLERSFFEEYLEEGYCQEDAKLKAEQNIRFICLQIQPVS